MADVTLSSEYKASAKRGLPVRKEMKLGINSGWKTTTDLTISTVATGERLNNAVYLPSKKAIYGSRGGASNTGEIIIWNDDGTLRSRNSFDNYTPWPDLMLADPEEGNIFLVHRDSDSSQWNRTQIANNIIITDQAFNSDFSMHGIIDKDQRAFFTAEGGKVYKYDYSSGLRRSAVLNIPGSPAALAWNKLAIAGPYFFLLNNNAYDSGRTYLYAYARGSFNVELTSFDDAGGNKMIPPKDYSADWYNSTDSIINSWTYHIHGQDNYLIVCNYKDNNIWGFYIIDTENFDIAEGSYTKYFLTPSDNSGVKIPAFTNGFADVGGGLGVYMANIPIAWDSKEKVLSYAYSDSGFGIQHWNFATGLGTTEETTYRVRAINKIDRNRDLVVTSSDAGTIMYVKNKYAYSDITDYALDYGRGTFRAEQPPNDTEFVTSKISIMLKNSDNYFDPDYGSSVWANNTLLSPVGQRVKMLLSRQLVSGAWSSENTLYEYQIVDFPMLDNIEKTASFTLAPLTYDFEGVDAKEAARLITDYVAVSDDTFQASEIPVVPGTVSVFLHDGTNNVKAIVGLGSTGFMTRDNAVYYAPSTGLFTIESPNQGYTDATIVYKTDWDGVTTEFIAKKLLDSVDYYDREILPSNVIVTDADEGSYDVIKQLPAVPEHRQVLMAGPEGSGYFWIAFNVQVTGSNFKYTQLGKYFISNNSIELVGPRFEYGFVVSGAGNQSQTNETLSGVYYNESTAAYGLWLYSIPTNTWHTNTNFDLNNTYGRPDADGLAYTVETTNRCYVQHFNGSDNIVFACFESDSGNVAPYLGAIPIGSPNAFMAAAAVHKVAIFGDVQDAEYANVVFHSPGGVDGGRMGDTFMALVGDMKGGIIAGLVVIAYQGFSYKNQADATAVLSPTNLFVNLDYRMAPIEIVSINKSKFIFTMSTQSHASNGNTKGGLFYYSYWLDVGDGGEDTTNWRTIKRYALISQIPRSLSIGSTSNANYCYLVGGNPYNLDNTGLGRMYRLSMYTGNLESELTSDNLGSYYTMSAGCVGTATNTIFYSGRIWAIEYNNYGLANIGVNSSLAFTSWNPDGRTMFEAMRDLAVDSHSTFFTTSVGRFIFKPKYSFGISGGYSTTPDSVAVEHFQDNVPNGNILSNIAKMSTIFEMGNVLTGVYNNGDDQTVYPPDGVSNTSVDLYGVKKLEIDFSSFNSSQDYKLVNTLLATYWKRLAFPRTRIKFTAPYYDWVFLKDNVTFKAPSIGHYFINSAMVDGVMVNYNDMIMSIELVYDVSPTRSAADAATKGGYFTLITSAETPGASVSVSVTSSEGFTAGDYVIIWTDWYSFSTTVASITSGTELVLTDVKTNIGANDRARIAVVSRTPAWDIDFAWDFHGWDINR